MFCEFMWVEEHTQMCLLQIQLAIILAFYWFGYILCFWSTYSMNFIDVMTETQQEM